MLKPKSTTQQKRRGAPIKGLCKRQPITLTLPKVYIEYIDRVAESGERRASDIVEQALKIAYGLPSQNPDDYAPVKVCQACQRKVAEGRTLVMLHHTHPNPNAPDPGRTPTKAGVICPGCGGKASPVKFSILAPK